MRWRRWQPELALTSLQVALAVWLLQADESRETLALLALLLASALWGWIANLRRLRGVTDTPTSRIASAAQGYAELRGHGEPAAGEPLRSPLDGLPVLWWRLVTERRSRDGKWRHESTEQSDASFVLVDGSGECAIAPEGAEMLVQRREVRSDGDRRWTQWTLLRGDPVYVLGEFFTVDASAGIDPKAALRDLLESWKADRAALLQRFDLDGDREIGVGEWALARAAARRELERRRDAAPAAVEAHAMRAPADGRLYLISDLEPERIARRYRLLSAWHLLVCVGAAAAIGAKAGF